MHWPQQLELMNNNNECRVLTNETQTKRKWKGGRVNRRLEHNFFSQLQRNSLKIRHVRITTFRITTLEDYRSQAEFLQIELEKAGFEHC